MRAGAITGEAKRDPYSDPHTLNRLVADTEALGQYVDGLSITILGVSRLDTTWKVRRLMTPTLGRLSVFLYVKLFTFFCGHFQFLNVSYTVHLN